MNIQKIGKLGRRYRHINRYRQIVLIIVKYGFADIINRLRIPKVLNLGRKFILRRPSIFMEIRTEERVRKIFEEIGPTFIKFGQIISTRPDLIPPTLITELKKLQDTVPSFSSESAKKTIKDELGKDVNEIFVDFKEDPIASASIAQVHYAKLKNNQEVVIKIQRPNIRKIIEIDLEIMFHLATLLEKHIDEMKLLRPVALVEEFSRSIEKEMDFTIELSHIELFKQNFASIPYTHVPKVYKDLSTDKVLVMEYIKGVRLAELKNKDIPGLDKKIIVERGARLILQQIFDFGVFHADPHPGNIMILPDNIICFLDYGMMGNLYGKARDNFSDLIINIIAKDVNLIVESLLKLTYTADLRDRDEFERDIQDFFDEFVYKKLKEVDITRLLQKFVNLLIIHRIRIKPNYYLLIKTLVTIEGVGRELNPDFNYIEFMQPFVEKIVRERLSPKTILRETKITLLDFIDLIKNLPENIKALISKLRTGTVKFEFEHKGLDPLVRIIERTFNHLTASVIIASLFISSSLIIVAKTPPLWYGISFIGLIGFFIASCMGLILLIIIHLEKKSL